MSYILKALKKSEKERQRNDVPNVQSQHTIPYPHLPGGSRKRTSPVAILLVCTIVLAGLLLASVVVNLSDFMEPTENPVAPETAKIDTPVAAPEKEESESSVDEQLPAAQIEPTLESENISHGSEPIISSQERVPTTYEPAPIEIREVVFTTNENLETISSPELPYLHELPLDIQERFPKIQYAGHTYSASPKDRMIILNNSILREGGRVEDDLHLEEITEDGIILNYQGLRFQMDVTQ